MFIERYVVWSPRAAACMGWTGRDEAERVARHWNATRLLGHSDWRVSAVARVPGAGGTGTIPALAAPRRAATAANDPATPETPDPHHRSPAARAWHAAIDTLQRRFDATVLQAARDAAERSLRIAELEARAVELEAKAAALEGRAGELEARLAAVTRLDSRRTG